jgi:ABC-2 type transport system permease protein
MDKIFLRFISFLNPMLAKAGVDNYQLYIILKTKLTIDNRRPKAMFAARKNAKNNTARSPWFVSFFTLLMGIFTGLVLFLNKMAYVGETFYFSIFMVLMALTLISDFTTVLIDTRDQYILLPRPVSDRTIAVSRVLHISIYILRLALLQGAPALVFIGFIDGIAAVPLFFFQILEATFMSIFLVNIVYLVLMKFVSPQKFKDIISYIQIGFSIVIFGTYYLLPRLINVSILENISILSHWYAYLLPPVWITALNELLIHHERSGMATSLLAITGLIVPLLGLWLVAKVLAPGFNRRLAIIATSDGNSNTQPDIKRAKRFGFIDKIAGIIAPDPVENAGFNITRKLAARTREFKMKVYPAFGYIPIYFLYFVLNGKGGDIAERWENIRNGHSYVFLVYMSTFILSSILMHISMSEKYKSAWVYYSTPISEPGKILSGMYKAIIVLYLLPYCIVLSIVTIAIWGPQTINDIILAILVSNIYGLLMALFMVKGLPFSKPVVVKQGGGRMIASLMILAFVGVIGFGHYYLVKWENVIWILIIPFLFINWLMFHYYKKQTWENIEQPDDL